MNVSIGKGLGGYVKIRIDGYSPERFLNLCKYKQIDIWDLEAKADGYEMYIRLKDVRPLKPLLKKARMHIRILERCGVPFFLHHNRKRKSFFLGSVLCIAFIFLLSRYIWKIEIDGNQTITNQVILEFLQEKQVFHGMKRSDVKCEEIVTDLRKEFQEIIWVSASLKGCNLIISVRENTDTFQVSQVDAEAGNIIASADGVITKIITRKGVPLVKVGDEVKKGDVLVSGVVEVLNDAGEVVRDAYVCSDADIYADVVLPYEDTCNRIYQQKVYTKKKRNQYYAKIKSLYFGVGFTGFKEEPYEIYSEEYRCVWNESFLLPISFGRRTILGYRWVEQKYSEEEMREILKNNLEIRCKELESEGTDILRKNVEIREEHTLSRLSGTLKVRQSIGTWVEIS